jgi:ribosomal protein S18 acetylase RimI-like enzyme
VIVRPAAAGDLPFLIAMLYEAACWRPGARPPADVVLTNPDIARYLRDWGRPGDLGVVAEEDGTPVGAAWIRLYDDADRGYGFVATDVPELTIGVTPAARGRGVGTKLLAELAAAATSHAISLSVETDNPAVRLYERAGYVPVAQDEGALTMLLELRPA